MLKTNKRILSLDIATSCGYAVYADGKVIDYGAWQLDKHKRGEEPRPYTTLYNMLSGIRQKYDIDYIVAESAFIPANNKSGEYKSLAAAASLFAKHGVVEMFCESNKIPYSEVSPLAAKRFMFNYRYGMRRETAKAAMINAVQRLGYELPNTKQAEDMADALGILFTKLGGTIAAPHNTQQQ